MALSTAERHAIRQFAGTGPMGKRFIDLLNELSAGTLSTTNITASGTLTVDGASTLTGNASLGGTLTVTGVTDINNNLLVGDDGFITITSVGSASVMIHVNDNSATALGIGIASGNKFINFDSTNAAEKLELAANSAMELGFFAVTPVARASAYTQTYATADKTHANPTGVAVAGSIPAGGTGAAAGAWDTAGNRDTAITTITEIKTSVNAAIVDLADLKQLVNSIIDDLQSYGLLS